MEQNRRLIVTHCRYCGAKYESANLKPCPFCGAKLYRWCGKYVHPDNDCVIFAMCDGLNGAKDYRDWNNRESEKSNEN